MHDAPAGPAGVDRSQWRCEEATEPYVVARAFLAWANGELGELEDGANVTTSESWPAWREAAVARELKGYLREVNHVSEHVCHPADGMAFIAAPIIHPDQDEPLLLSGEVYANIFTLLLENDTWKVHQLGPPPPPSPADLGKEAYSW